MLYIIVYNIDRNKILIPTTVLQYSDGNITLLETVVHLSVLVLSNIGYNNKL